VIVPQHLHENLLELEPCLLHEAVGRTRKAFPDLFGATVDDCIKRSLERGDSYRAIKEKYKVSHQRTTDIAAKHGLLRTQKNKAKRLEPSDREQIIADFRNGLTVKQVEVKHGIANSTARVYKARAAGRDY